MAQIREGFEVPPGLRFRQRELVTYRLARRPIPNLPGTEIGSNLLREPRRIEHAQGGAPGVSVDRNLLLPETLAHRIDQLIESEMNWSSVLEDLGILQSNDLSVPRCSQ